MLNTVWFTLTRAACGCHVDRVGAMLMLGDTRFGVDVLCAPFTEVPCALDAGAAFTTGGVCVCVCVWQRSEALCHVLT